MYSCDGTGMLTVSEISGGHHRDSALTSLDQYLLLRNYVSNLSCNVSKYVLILMWMHFLALFNAHAE